MKTNQQVKKLRQKMNEGNTQETAAVIAGMSERSARKWQKGPLPSERITPRTWRTRSDPFDGVWEQIVVPLLQDDPHRQLEAPTVLAVLQERVPGRFTRGQTRSLQRRIQEWRVLFGGHKEVFFPQSHLPGREGAFDFTHCTELGVTLAGVLFVHLLFLLVLPFSGWVWASIAFAETFEAMLLGVQSALWELEGVPEVLRSDNLSAATHELSRAPGRGLTRRYTELLDHYGAKSTRITPGKSNENGGVESRNGRIKSALAQALIVRGSSDFRDMAEYEGFVREVVERTFRAPIDPTRMALERKHLLPLPAERLPTWSSYRVRVTRWSTIEVGKRIYSVPSRLMGAHVQVRVYPDHLEVRYRERLTATMPRLHGSQASRINYRDIIWSLVQKPGAFARYRFREELFPSLIFRRAYDALTASQGSRADAEYVRVLHLAASTLESEVQAALEALLLGGESFDYAAVKALVAPVQPTVPQLSIGSPDLRPYDALLAGGMR